MYKLTKYNTCNRFSYVHTFYCRHNIRDVFEIFRAEQDVGKSQELLARGWRNLEAMRRLSSLKDKDHQDLFVP